MKSLKLFLLLLSSFALHAQEQGENEVAITDLMFSENWFSDLGKAKLNPDEVFYLDLSLQKHKIFPKEILTFTNLERLYLPYNYWPAIPEEIGTLTKLKVLDLSGNYYLNFLPKEGLSKLANLREFLIKDNKLAKGEIEKARLALPNCKIVSE